MNKTHIEYADYTLNPIVGCKNGCYYCFAKRINALHQWAPNFNPTPFLERLEQVYKRKKPSIIFLVDMGDIFSNGVHKTWVEQIIKTISENPQHTFLILTKQPKGFEMFSFPLNTWLGVSVDKASWSQQRLEIFRDLKVMNNRFISVEPILSYMNALDFKFAQLVIIGAMTGRKPVTPLRQWVEGIKHPNIFYKDNLIKHFPDLPKGSKEQILKFNF